MIDHSRFPMFSNNDSRHFRHDGPSQNVRPRLHTQRGPVTNTSTTAGTYRRPMDTSGVVFDLSPAARPQRPNFVPRRNIVSHNMNQSLSMPNEMEGARVRLPRPQSATGMTNFGVQELTSSDEEAVARHYESIEQVNEIAVRLDNMAQQCEELKDNMSHYFEELKDVISQQIDALKEKLDDFARATEAMLQSTTQDAFAASSLGTQEYQPQDYGFKLT